MLKIIELRIGDKGPKVKEAVKMLQEAGSTIKDTDRYHIGMYAAVISFQGRHRLAQTGIIDQKTWDLLKTYKVKIRRPARKTVKMAGKK